jgi:hypothetical protein
MGMLRRAGPVLITALAIIVLAALVIGQIHSSRNQANAATVVAGYLAALTPLFLNLRATPIGLRATPIGAPA